MRDEPIINVEESQAMIASMLKVSSPLANMLTHKGDISNGNTYMGHTITSIDRARQIVTFDNGGEMTMEAMRNAERPGGQLWDSSTKANAERLYFEAQREDRNDRFVYVDEPIAEEQVLVYRCPFCKKEDCICGSDNAVGEGPDATETGSPIACESPTGDSAFDKLMSSASVPTLAELFRAGKKAGVLKPQHTYN